MLWRFRLTYPSQKTRIAVMTENNDVPDQHYDTSPKQQSFLEYLNVLGTPPRDSHKVENDRKKEQDGND